MPVNKNHRVVNVKLPKYPPDGRNQLQASEIEFMTSAHEDECSQLTHNCLSQFAGICEKLLMSLWTAINSSVQFKMPSLNNTEWPKKIYTLFTHQYLWNKFK